MITFAAQMQMTKVGQILTTRTDQKTLIQELTPYPTHPDSTPTNQVEPTNQQVKTWEQVVRIEQEHWEQCKKDKSNSILMILRQCDKETQTQLKQDADVFKTTVQDGDLLGFLKLLKAVCLESDKHGMAY